jgi:hypothetical protein
MLTPAERTRPSRSRVGQWASLTAFLDCGPASRDAEWVNGEARPGGRLCHPASRCTARLAASRTGQFPVQCGPPKTSSGPSEPDSSTATRTGKTWSGPGRGQLVSGQPRCAPGTLPGRCGAPQCRRGPTDLTSDAGDENSVRSDCDPTQKPSAAESGDSQRRSTQEQCSVRGSVARPSIGPSVPDPLEVTDMRQRPVQIAAVVLDDFGTVTH